MLRVPLSSNLAVRQIARYANYYKLGHEYKALVRANIPKRRVLLGKQVVEWKVSGHNDGDELAYGQILHSINGKIFEGKFENNEFLQGTITNPDGSQIHGKFKKNAFNGEYELVPQ